MPKQLSLVLPWPDKRLSPNARVHWRTKAAATRRARRTAYNACLKAQWPRWPLGQIDEQKRTFLSIAFYAPDRRRRDDDNLIAAFKPYRDGLSDYTRIDDSHFACGYALCGPARDYPKGAVVVALHLPTDG